MSESKNEIGKVLPVVPESQVYESIRNTLTDARTKAFNAENSAMVIS